MILDVEGGSAGRGQPVDDAYTVTGRVLDALGKARAASRERPGGEPPDPVDLEALAVEIWRGAQAAKTGTDVTALLLAASAALVQHLERGPLGRRR